jgi:hypothetical protein
VLVTNAGEDDVLVLDAAALEILELVVDAVPERPPFVSLAEKVEVVVSWIGVPMTAEELKVNVLVTNAGPDDVLVLEAAALETTVLLTTVTLMGTSEVETTVEDAGQFVTSEEHEVTVVMSVL